MQYLRYNLCIYSLYQAFVLWWRQNMSEGKVVKLDSVLKLLEDAAKVAHENARECIGVDTSADSYFQGLRNGYIKSAELLRENSDRLV